MDVCFATGLRGAFRGVAGLPLVQPFDAFAIGSIVKENPPGKGGKEKIMVGHAMFGMLYEVGIGSMLVYGYQASRRERLCLTIREVDNE